MLRSLTINNVHRPLVFVHACLHVLLSIPVPVYAAERVVVGGITQRLECLPVTQEVAGSNPASPVCTALLSMALGGMVYTVDLKSAPIKVMGSSPIVPSLY